jgi:hypothetical protein
MSRGFDRLSPNGGMVFSPNGGVGLRPDGDVVFSPNGGVVFSPNGDVVFRPDGDAVLSPNPFSPFALSLSKGPCHRASTGSGRTVEEGEGPDIPTPFTLSLSKGPLRKGFDRLAPNADVVLSRTGV